MEHTGGHDHPSGIGSCNDKEGEGGQDDRRVNYDVLAHAIKEAAAERTREDGDYRDGQEEVTGGVTHAAFLTHRGQISGDTTIADWDDKGDQRYFERFAVNIVVQGPKWQLGALERWVSTDEWSYSKRQ